MGVTTARRSASDRLQRACARARVASRLFRCVAKVHRQTVSLYRCVPKTKNEGVRKMQTAERKAVVGWPDLERLTTSHIERAFLTVRQELKRYQRKGLGYSKDLGNAQAGRGFAFRSLQFRPQTSHAQNNASGRCRP